MAVTHTETRAGVTYGFDFEDQEIETDALADFILVDDLKEVIRDAEDSVTGIGHPIIADTQNPYVLDPSDSTSTFQGVILLESWRILTLKTSGTFTVKGGNCTRHDTGFDIFSLNPSVTTINTSSQAGVRITAGSGVTEGDKDDIRDRIFDHEILTGVSFENYSILMRRILYNESDITVNGDNSRTIEVYDENGRAGGTVAETWTIDATGLLRSN